MNKITLQDIVTKKLNNLAVTPEDLIADAYYSAIEAETTRDKKDYVIAYISAQTAVEANKACGVKVPNLELEAVRMKRECGMATDQEIADYYMEHLDK